MPTRSLGASLSFSTKPAASREVDSLNSANVQDLPSNQTASCDGCRRVRQRNISAIVRIARSLPHQALILSPRCSIQGFLDLFQQHCGPLMLDLADKARTVLDLDRKSEAVLFSVQQNSLDEQFGAHFAGAQMIDNDAGAHRDLPWLKLIFHQARA